MRLFILSSLVFSLVFFFQISGSLAQEQPNNGHESTASPSNLSATAQGDCNSASDFALNDNTNPGDAITVTGHGESTKGTN